MRSEMKINVRRAFSHRILPSVNFYFNIFFFSFYNETATGFIFFYYCKQNLAEVNAIKLPLRHVRFCENAIKIKLFGENVNRTPYGSI